MTKTILIVEDDPKNLTLFRDLLQVSGYKTIEAKLEAAKQAVVNVEKVTQAIELAKDNLSESDLKLILEWLAIRVTLGKESITIEGIVPISDGALAPTPSKRNGERIPSMWACQLTQLGQSIPLGWGLPHLGHSGGITLDSELRQE